MKKKFIGLIFLLTSCYTIIPTQIRVSTYNNYWDVKAGGIEGSGVVLAIPQNTYPTTAEYSFSMNFSVYLTFFPKEKSCNELENKPRYNYMTVRFYKMPNGKFDMNKVYITKNGKKYHLQPIQSPNDFTVIPAKITSVGTNSFFWYKVPLFCGSLENAVFEMSGIYSDGKELPPVRFQINLLNPTEIKS